MNVKKITAYAALVGGMSLGALGFGAGFAHAETGTVQSGSHDQFVQAPSVDTHGDQDVVPRGTVIPVHGDDEFRKDPAKYTPNPGDIVHSGVPPRAVVVVDPSHVKNPHEVPAPHDDASGAS